MFANAVRPAAGMIRPSAVGSDYQVPNDDIAAAFPVTTGWAWDETRGYYRDVADYGSDGVAISIPNIADISAISATFHGYYNSPAGCLGENSILIRLDNGYIESLGTRDAWRSAGSGQTIYKGDDGYESQISRNVVGETYTYTIPAGRYVAVIEVRSQFLSGLPAADRGMRDISVTYRG